LPGCLHPDLAGAVDQNFGHLLPVQKGAQRLQSGGEESPSATMALMARRSRNQDRAR
jgi:hypothetical protein